MAKLFGLSLAAAVVLVAAAAVYVAQAQTAAGPRPPRGGEIAKAVCAACHGAAGNSSDGKVSKLAAQHATYLRRQLEAFKTGSRGSDIMSGVVAGLSDADMANAAAFYSRQALRPDAVENPRLAAVGERIFLAGGGAGISPPCAMCHGARGQRRMPMMGMMGGRPMMGMMGMMADAPRLNGQHAAYIVDQLNRFASGERQAMMMGRIAATLTETDKAAVAEYLSSRP